MSDWCGSLSSDGGASRALKLRGPMHVRLQSMILRARGGVSFDGMLAKCQRRKGRSSWPDGGLKLEGSGESGDAL